MGKLGRYDYFKHDKPTDKFITNFTSQDNQGIIKQMLATVGFGVDNPHVKINTKTLNVDVDVFKEFGKSIEGKLDDDTKSVDLDNTVESIFLGVSEKKNVEKGKIVEISQEQRDNTFKEVLLNISGEYKEFQNYSNFCTNTTKIYSNDYWFSNSTMIGESFKLGE